MVKAGVTPVDIVKGLEYTYSEPPKIGHNFGITVQKYT